MTTPADQVREALEAAERAAKARGAPGIERVALAKLRDTITDETALHLKRLLR